MTRTLHPTPRRHLRDHIARFGIALAFAISAAAVAEAAAILNPTLPGEYAAGTGANATFNRIDGSWKRTSAYYNEPAHEFGNDPNAVGFLPISSFSWGTGIWGLADWVTINEAASKLVVGTWSGLVPSIDHADADYVRCYSEATSVEPEPACKKWGWVDPLPVPPEFFGSSGEQDNWTSHYTGYLRITDPGNYNFGVMYDDGFFLRIWGADGSMVEISSDFLSPRDRLGFYEDLQLNTGLYRFELGAYDRLEVGVVNLAWMQDGHWVTVPTEHLVTDPVPIPTPATAGLLLAALGALAMVRMKRKRA